MIVEPMELTGGGGGASLCEGIKRQVSQRAIEEPSATSSIRGYNGR
jgi:hypothetical protein